MTNDTHARRVTDAHAIGASLTLLKTTGSAIHKDAASELAEDFWNYLYVPEPALLLVPTIDRHGLQRGIVLADGGTVTTTVRPRASGVEQTRPHSYHND